MQRHSGQLPARRYGPRRQSVNHNRHAHPSTPAFPTSDPRPGRSHLKSTDDESASPIEHSMAASAHHHNHPQSSQQLSSPATTLPSDEAISPSHGALKLAHASSREQSIMDSMHSPPAQHHHHAHRNTASSPVAVQFGSAAARFYPNPSMPAPLAHTASWLAAAGATAAGLNAKGRPTTSPYENFGLGSYGFQHPGSLSRLSLLSGSPSQAAHGAASGSSESEHTNKQPQQGSEPTTTSSAQPGNQSSQHQYTQSTANPDFSQLLD